MPRSILIRKHQVIASEIVLVGIITSLSLYTYCYQYSTRPFDLFKHLRGMLYPTPKTLLPTAVSSQDTRFEGPGPEPNQRLINNDPGKIHKITQLHDFILNLSDVHITAVISFSIAAITQASRQPGMHLYHMLLVHEVITTAFISHCSMLFVVYGPRLKATLFSERWAALLVLVILVLVFKALLLSHFAFQLRGTGHCPLRLSPSYLNATLVLVFSSLAIWIFTICQGHEREPLEVDRSTSNNNVGNTDHRGTQAPPGTPVGHPPEGAATQMTHSECRERFHRFGKFRVVLYFVRGGITLKGLALFVLLEIYFWGVYCIITIRKQYKPYLEDRGDEDKWGFGQVAPITALFAGVIFQFIKAYKGLAPI